MNRKDTLDAAAACVLTDRQRTHGPIENSFGLTASFWSAYLSVPVTPTAVADMMTLLKIARAKSNPLNADNRVDAAGYQACAAELAESMAAPDHDEGMKKINSLIAQCFPIIAGMSSDAPDVDDLRECPMETVTALRKDYAAKRRLRDIEVMRSQIDTSMSSDAPAAPQAPPEGDHSQTDAGAQGDAIPDDYCHIWHNPREVSMSPEEHAEGWRLLLWDEEDVPADAEYWNVDGERWMPRAFKNRGRRKKDTYRTRAPLPRCPFPAKAIDAAISEAPAVPEGWWHNPDNVVLTDEDKSKGWRFLFVGEPVTPDDTQVIDDQGKWHKLPADFKAPCGTCRTQTPLPYLMHIQPAPSTPPVPEPQWHNPEMIDPSHLTSGRRFLLKDETEMPGDVEVFSHFDKKWAASSSAVRFAGWTYATRAPLPGAPAPVDHNLHQTTP